MTTRNSTLRAGLLVSLSTSIVGNTEYLTETIEAEHVTDDGKAVSEWNTRKTVKDPDEEKAASQARGKARNVVTKVCSQLGAWLLCPRDAKADLDAAVIEGHRVVNEFNAGSTYSKIRFNVITATIEGDDEKAARAINSEIRGLMTAMEAGIRDLDVEKIRDNANRLKEVGQMLSPQARDRAQLAIDSARMTATRIKAAGDAVSIEINNIAIRNIAESRLAFLDLDDAVDVAAPTTEGPALDLGPANDDAAEILVINGAPVTAPQIDVAAE